MSSLARHVAAAFVVASVALGAAPALAQPAVPSPPAEAGDKERARALANRGYELFQERRFEEANSHFREAERAFHATTIVVMIGTTYEELGRLADAEAVYELAATEALPSDAPPAFVQAQSKARERVEALAADVPRVELRPIRPLGERALTARIDGTPVPHERLGRPLALNPGARVIEVSVGGGPAVRHPVEAVRGARTVIDVDWTDPPPVTAAARPSSRRDLAAPAVIAFAVGGAGLIMGSVAGLVAVDKRSELDDRCPDQRCAPGDRDLADEIGTSATFSTIGFVVAGLGAATGGVLWWLHEGDGDVPTPSVAVAPTPVGVVVMGTF